MKIEIKIKCDCECEFIVKLPDCCYGKDNKNPFVLNCPYCQKDINHEFHIKKSVKD
jgi:hypothetical protein